MGLPIVGHDQAISAQNHAAVDGEVDAGDERRVIRRQEQCRCRDLVARPKRPIGVVQQSIRCCRRHVTFHQR